MPQSSLARASLVFALGMTVLALGMAAWFWTQPGALSIARTGQGTASGSALVGGPFELVDQDGKTRRDTDFRGRYMLVYFGYTYCPDICPTSLLAMSQAVDGLGETDPALTQKFVPIFITVDPERDTVEAMAAYAPNFHEDLVALTGTAEQVAAAAKAYRVYYAKAGEEGADDYLMDHSGFIYLMGPEGEYLAHFPHNATAEEMSAALRGYLGS